MKQVVIFVNPHKDKEFAVTGQIKEYLRQKGIACSVLVGGEKETEKIPSSDFLREPKAGADCMIVLGGDGTMLQAAWEAKGAGIPLIGVNLGTLGYMTEVEISGLREALDQLTEGSYKVESRMMLQGKVLFSDGTRQEDLALNDIVIARSGSIQIMQYHIYVNGQFLNSYHADGVIVTTPTGSTGYNLSAGGPIVQPTAKLIMVTPICPHTLNQRSVIFAPEDEIEIVIPEGREGKEQTAEASFDGKTALLLHTGDRIRVTKSEETTKIIRLNKISFLDILHQKLREN